MDGRSRTGQNAVLMVQNTVRKATTDDADVDVAARVARRSLDRRGADYADEVRRLIDAGLGVIRRCGTDSRPRVADIVAAAGLSNDAFYRHFPSKDALVGAILEDGNARLGAYVAHQMTKSATPEGKIRRWVEGVMSQADDDIAATTRAVIWNASGPLAGVPAASTDPIATPLHLPLAASGQRRPGAGRRAARPRDVRPTARAPVRGDDPGTRRDRPPRRLLRRGGANRPLTTDH